MSGASRTGASSKLVKRTFHNQNTGTSRPERRLRVRHFKAAGVVQVGWSTLGGPKRPGVKGQGVDPEENRRRALGRAKANITRACLSLACDRMLTGTYRENMTRKGLAFRQFHAWVRLVKRRYPNLKGVMVWERQERGAWHWHMAVEGFYDVDYLRKCWRRVAGEGTVNVAFKPDGKGNAYSKLANYLAKYLAKDVEQERSLGEHRYHNVGHWEVPGEVIAVSVSNPTSSTLMACEIVYTLLQGTPGGVNLYTWSKLHYGYVTGALQQCQSESRRARRRKRKSNPDAHSTKASGWIS